MSEHGWRRWWSGWRRLERERSRTDGKLVEEFNEITTPFAERIMDAAIKPALEKKYSRRSRKKDRSFDANCKSDRDVYSTMGLKWDQAEEIAEVLAENHPGLNPLDARFTDLRQWVIDLDEFDDEPRRLERRKTGSHPDGVERNLQGTERRRLNRRRRV